ncbi:MAG: glycosyltransferase [Bacteroidaceae bacterium]
MLSTYNGQRYLKEQLKSLYNQKDVNLHILVRDDGSIDDTLKILKEYKEKHGRMTIYEDKNIGVVMSFHTLMSYAYRNFTNYDYYAFCDQDDFWMEDKLSIAVKMLANKESALYYSNAYITDSNLNIIEVKKPKYDLTPQYILFRQPALGCTQVITKRFFKLCTEIFAEYKKHNPTLIELHDVWTIQLALFLGVDIIIDATPHIMYRQHANNVTSYKKEGIIGKVKRVSRRFNRYKGLGYENIQILKKILHDKLTPESKELFRRITTYKDSILNTLSFALYMQKFFSSLSIKAMVIYKIINRLY